MRRAEQEISFMHPDLSPSGGISRRALLLAGSAALLAYSRAGAAQAPARQNATAVAREAWIYGYPMIMNYNTMHRQAIDARAPEYVGGFNVFRHYAQFFTPENRDVVTPNNDTPYSWSWLDLRAEPMVLSVPKVSPIATMSVSSLICSPKTSPFLAAAPRGGRRRISCSWRRGGMARCRLASSRCTGRRHRSWPR
jgi:hypothetical protein